ncbi:TetR/AcrR family transcriptional regulator [Nocardia uniformis]|uniref:TetR/AcrR family transcriptional regulator n=1 Tax=Nocardia uniformis TaxID=53432 RepID=A0A849BWI1_9NOCA|nr:TetR/AcrR family transcriptional regulator [Nocardia uniformis]NNH70922.1 TetR/AcrR family transcriptional regulator [Nocardia uniformis]
MTRPKPLTRGESQAQTREAVLQAAEELFLTKGFHDTTVAQIAAAAGRTQGSIYGNFSGKERLCQAVLERRYSRSFAELAAEVGAADDNLDGKLDAFARWWRELSADEPLTVLMTEFTLAVRKDPAQFTELTAFWEVLKTVLRSTIAGTAHATANPDDDPQLDAAVTGIVTGAIGLAISQVSGLVDNHASGAALKDLIRIWIERLDAREGNSRKRSRWRRAK